MHFIFHFYINSTIHIFFTGPEGALEKQKWMLDWLQYAAKVTTDQENE
jgi:hypothetical protein